MAFTGNAMPNIATIQSMLCVWRNLSALRLLVLILAFVLIKFD